MALLINIPFDNVEKFDDLNSIDEIANKLKWDVEEGTQYGIEYNLSPETEFLGHCSNLQA